MQFFLILHNHSMNPLQNQCYQDQMIKIGCNLSLLQDLYLSRSFPFYNILLNRLMGTIQSKIRESYFLTQKPRLKKKSQKGIKPSLDFHEKSHFSRKNSYAQNGQVAQLTNISTHPTSLTEMQSCQSFDQFSSDADSVNHSKNYPATAIGLVQSRFDEHTYYGVGSIIGSNIVLTTAHQLFSLKSKSQPISIKFFLSNGSSQVQFEVEKTFFSQSYRHWDTNEEEGKEKIFLEDFGIIILKTNIDIQKTGILGFDFNQRQDIKECDAAIYGFNQRKNSLKMQNVQLKVKLKQYNIKYNTFFHFSVLGGPILSKQDHQYTIIGIQNVRRHHSMQQKSLRLNEKMFIIISQWITQQEEQVDLRNKSLGKSGVKQLIKQEKTSFSSINISQNKIGPEGLKYFTRRQWNNLHHLDIGGNEIKKEGVMHLIKIPMKNLLSLNMWGNSIESEGALLLLEADWKHLSNINLYKNNICNEGVKSLIKANWEQLESINLGTNNLNSAIISSFQYAVWTNIVSLTLWGNSIKNCKTTQNELKKYFVKAKFLYL